MFATADLAMDINDLLVRATTGNSVDIAVTLPSVVEAVGRIYCVELTTDGGKNVVINDYGDDNAYTQATLDTAAQYVLLYSDGYVWRTLCSSTA